jgi:type II secretory ATPase GspE/PulE/Tfp pilus assembly ATPase PilB-like protein
MLGKSQATGIIPLDAQQIFALIDSILPLEVCLHYQILPLALKENHLYLGVVDSEDESALEYVQKIVSYMNCSIRTQMISSAEERSLLSSYLYYKQQDQKVEENTSIVQDISNSESQNVSQNVVEHSNIDSAVDRVNVPSPELHVSFPTIIDDVSLNLRESTSMSSLNLPSVLDVNTTDVDNSLEDLARLSAQDLLKELLSRVLIGGIGRLYFERENANSSRILWSQDGVLQSVVTGLGNEQFQGVINELKLWFDLPLLPIDKPRQVEIERVYQDTHLLLRLRISPGTFGEEANLQVLRGAALKFYQKQQLSKLSLDAIRLAQQLQNKLSEINTRLTSTPLSSDNLILLNQLLKMMVQQSDALIEKSQNSDRNH